MERTSCQSRSIGGISVRVKTNQGIFEADKATIVYANGEKETYTSEEASAIVVNDEWVASVIVSERR